MHPSLGSRANHLSSRIRLLGISAVLFPRVIDLCPVIRPGLRAARAASTSDEQCSSPSARIKYLRAMGRMAAGEMHSQLELVEHLRSHKWLESEHCVNAMLRVDRRDFVQPDMPLRLVYQDRPLPNGPTETISAPHMHATALQLLSDQLRPGARILDVGSGSGYLTACFAYAAEPGGYVLGIEKFESLARQSVVSLRTHHRKLLDEGIIEIQAANVLGLEAEEVDEEDKFAAIHVGAAAATIPQDLCSLLARGGRMVIPVGPQHGPQVLTIVDRVDPEGSPEPALKVRELMGVQYVPLTPPSAGEGDESDSHSDGMHEPGHDFERASSGSGGGGGAEGGVHELQGERHAWRAPTSHAAPTS
eukprot:jgi/Ulvmu1/10676/UM066_0060.1